MNIICYTKNRKEHASIKDLVNFASKTAVGLNVHLAEIHIEDSHFYPYKMKAYKDRNTKIPTHKNSSCLAVIKLGKEENFPTIYKSKYDSIPDILLRTWKEALIFMAAYVLRELWQIKNKDGYISKVMNERAGVRALIKWRKLQ